MDKKFIQKQKEKLEERKASLEARLSSFARESESTEGDWHAKMPLYNTDGAIEEEADEVEEFGTRLSMEKTLEQELKDINLALDNIKNNKYGICEKCGKPIAKGRLEVYPQARDCAKCHH